MASRPLPKGERGCGCGPILMDHPSATTILRGQTLAFRDDPFKVEPDAAVDFHADGAVAIAEGKILEVGAASDVIAHHPGAVVENYAGHLIMAGFVDCHVHYPQIDIIASYGEQLLAWLENTPSPPRLGSATAATPMRPPIGFSTNACATASPPPRSTAPCIRLRSTPSARPRSNAGSAWRPAR